jgi:hypothetical protein
VAELTQEQFEQLPEFVRGDYEKAGEVYRPVAEGKLSALKGSLNDLDSKYKQANSRIEEIERSKAQEIENAKAEALKTARSKGDVETIEKRYQEQMADLEKRNGETLKQYEDRLKVRDERFVSSERKSIVGDISKELKILDKSEKLFFKLVQDRISVDPESGKVTFLDENGGATSLDKNGFIAELSKDEGFDSMRHKPLATGGMANGNNSGNGGADDAGKSEATKDAESAKKKGDLGGFLNAKLSNVGAKK